MGALQLAALRGVDVRILMPRESDSIFFKYVPYAYLDEVARAGVRVFLYEDGFMHQKVAVVDDDFAAVGTANFDNRSFRLNFEVTVVAHDEGVCRDVVGDAGTRPRGAQRRSASKPSRTSHSCSGSRPTGRGSWRRCCSVLEGENNSTGVLPQVAGSGGYRAQPADAPPSYPAEPFDSREAKHRSECAREHYSYDDTRSVQLRETREHEERDHCARDCRERRASPPDFSLECRRTTGEDRE